MCLGVPMKIESIEQHMAICNANGIIRSVNLFMMQQTPLAPGDYVLVHVGYAIQKIAAQQAQQAWQLDDAIQSKGKQ